MALTNFTLPFGGISHHWGAATTIAPSYQQYHASAVNNLLYDPADHQESDDPPDYFKNNPYAPPQNQYNNNNNNINNNNGRLRNSKSYLPPLPPSSASTQRHNTHHPHNADQEQQLGYNSRTRNNQDHNTQYNNHQSQHQHHQQQQQQPAVQIPSASYLPVHQQPPLLPSQHPQDSSRSSYSPEDDDSVYSSQQYGPPSPAPSLPSSASSSASIPLPAHDNQGQYFNGYNTHTRTFSSHNIAPGSVGNPAPEPGLTNRQQLPTYSSNNAAGRNVNNQNRNNNYNSGSTAGPNRGDPTAGFNAKPTVKANNRPSSNPVLPPTPDTGTNNDDDFPGKPPGFTRVQAGQGSRTQVHAVLDYDIEEGEEEYYDDTDDGKKSSMPTVTPIQGPIFLKNGTVPVVPLFSYPTVNNGTFVQIPIWWTALSVALGLDIRGDVIRGVPCIKRYHQLFCPTAGNSYPIEKIEKFIDDNKALMRRMYGDFEMTDGGSAAADQARRRRRRFTGDPDIFMPPGAYPADAFEAEPDTEAGDTYFGKLRKKRQSSGNRNKNNQKPGAANNRGGNAGRASNTPNGSPDSGSGKVDVCESKVEVVTPYWASNSAGKIRAIVNTQHFEQAIHQEMCTKVTTARCGNDCGCEQKYKWHRLLAYDPDNDCKGIFMDWFLFPSCCVCRCSP